MNKDKKEVTDKTRIANINKICKAVLKLTEEDFKAVEEMANNQQAYFSPLKMATMHRLHDLGDHNHRVCKGLRDLQVTIKLLQNPNQTTTTDGK